MEHEKSRESFDAITRPKRLSDAIARAIASRIYEGIFRPGERLPTEAQLCAEFDVSRAVVREAIARLRQDGLVTSRQGRGVFVTERPLDRALKFKVGDLRSERELLWIYELRLALETGAAALAAERRTRAQLAELEKQLHEMEVTADGVGYGARADLAFHRTVAEASHNPYHRDLLDYLATSLTETITLARRNATEKGVPAQAQEEHRLIYEAIKEKNPAAARKAAEHHLLNGMRRLILLSDFPET